MLHSYLKTQGDQKIDELMDELNCFSQEMEKSMISKKELEECVEMRSVLQ